MKVILLALMFAVASLAAPVGANAGPNPNCDSCG